MVPRKKPKNDTVIEMKTKELVPVFATSIELPLPPPHLSEKGPVLSICDAFVEQFRATLFFRITRVGADFENTYEAEFLVLPSALTDMEAALGEMRGFIRGYLARGADLK
jgi:hypothetical protein